MKLLFATSDPARVDLVKTRLHQACIPCEVRESRPAGEDLPLYPEVWVRDGDDYECAVAIFCNRGSHRFLN